MNSRAARRSILALAVLTISVAGLWWVTAGGFRIFERIAFGNVFDAQAMSFIKGHVDVDCTVASGEAFRRDDKCYIYFGPVPALMRVPVMLLRPIPDGLWTRLMVLAANFLLLAIVSLFLSEAGYPPDSWIAIGYLLLAAFGSTMPYILAWPTAYVEVISWAVTFSAASLYCLVRWSTRREGRWLIAGCVAATLAFFTRVNTGAGPMFAVGVIALSEWMRGRNRQAANRTLALLAAATCVFIAYNHARFETYLNSVPIHLHVQYNAARLENVQGTLFHPEQAFYLFGEYLIHPPLLRSSYPWLQYRPGITTNIDLLDMTDAHVGALFLMPALAWLAFGAWRSEPRKLVRRILLSPLIGLLLLSCVAAINHRYIHEFALLFLPAGVYGLRWAGGVAWRKWLTVAFAAWSIYANWAIALVGQREVQPWISEAALDRHRATRYLVDKWVSGQSDAPFEFDYLRGGAPPPVTGLEVNLASPAGSRYRFDGARWQHLSGPLAHHFRLDATFKDPPSQPVYNLIVAGVPPEIDVISLVRAPSRRYAVCMDHFGAPRECGAEFNIEPGRPHVFDFDLDRLNREIRITFDGVQVASRQIAIARWSDSAVKVEPVGQP